MRNPIVHLVEKRRRGQYGNWFIESCGAVVAYLVLAPALTQDDAWSAAGGHHLVFTLALLLLLVVPLVACLPTARFFSTLREGRHLDDLLITRLSPASIVDGIAWSSARSVMRFGVLALPLLLVLSGGNPWLLLWWPALVALSCALVYPTLLLGSADPAKKLLALLIYALAVGCVVWINHLTGPLPVLALAVVCVWARDLVLADLTTTLGGPHHLVKHGGRPFPLRLPHAILMREWARQSRRVRVPGGAVAWVLLQILPWPLLTLAAGALRPLGWLPSSMVCLVALFIVQPLRTVWRSGVALVGEKDAGTLDLVHHTPVRAAGFVDGWALSSTLLPVIETTLTIPMFIHWLGAQTGLLLAASLLALIVVSGYLGVMMSSVAPNKTMARRFLHVWTALYIGFGVAPVALAVAMAVPGAEDGWQVLPLVGAVSLVIFRTMAIARVKDDRFIPGFCP
ncbi:MAG TPA: hypothetical protein VGO93_10825 [Candidatus Xenobia bacterium]